MHTLHRALRVHALYASLLVSLAAIALYAGRVLWTGEPTFLFLPRNLVLGWLPVPLAVLASGLLGSRRGAIAAVPVLLAWLVFLPNSVYLLTDLIHLRSRAGIPHVYDSTLCGVFAGAGVLAGLSAISIVESAVSRVLGRWPTAFALVPVWFLTGVGVWLGRYRRWNSWDLVSDPMAIVRDVWVPLSHPSAHLWGISLTYAAVLGVSWLAFVSVRSGAPAREPVTAG